MPPPDIPPPLLGIQQAAQAIAVERQRLNNGFAALQSAAELLAPGFKLKDDGTLVREEGSWETTVEVSITPPPPTPPPSLPPTPEPTGPGAQEPPAAPETGEDVPPQRKPVEDKPPTMREAILALLTPGQRKSASRIATEIDRPVNSVSSMLSKMRADGQLVRIEPSSSGHSVPMFMRAAQVQSRPTEGNGSPSSTKFPSSSEPESPPSLASEPEAEPEEDGSGKTARESTKAASSTPLSTGSRASLREGPARSPKPRSEMRPQQQEAEERLDSLVYYMADQDVNSFNPSDVADALGIERQSKVRSDMDILVERGVLERTGNLIMPQTVLRDRARKIAEGVSSRRVGGRPANEYALVDWDSKSPKADEDGVAEDEATVVGDTEVRDALVRLKECTLEELAAHLNIEPEETNLGMLRDTVAQFILKGMVVVDRESGHMSYQRPTDPGAAALMDMARTPEERLAEVQGRGETVAGTGRGFRAASKEVQALVDAAIRLGGKPSMSGGHIKITAPNGQSVNISSTPNPRALANDRTRLRRLFPSLARG